MVADQWDRWPVRHFVGAANSPPLPCRDPPTIPLIRRHIRDHDDPVHMVRHHHERITHHHWHVIRYGVPTLLHHRAHRVRHHRPIGNTAEQMCPFMGAYRDVIRPGMRVIVPPQSNGTSMEPFCHDSNISINGGIFRSSNGQGCRRCTSCGVIICQIGRLHPSNFNMNLHHPELSPVQSRSSR